MRVSRALAAALLLLLTLPAAARAGESVTLRTAFDPYRLGASTTILYGFQIRGTEHELPAPMTSVNLELPANMGLATSNLGLATCETATLELVGPEACPANSFLGYGTAVVQVPVGDTIIRESASVTALFGPPQHENLVVLFYAEGHSPISSQVVFPGELLPDNGRFGEQLATAVPVKIAWPGGPYVSVVSFSSSIGPLGLTYYRHRHSRYIPYSPRGISVPARCPHGGFPFRAEFTFNDGNRLTATSHIPCPASTGGHRPGPAAR